MWSKSIIALGFFFLALSLQVSSVSAETISVVSAVPYAEDNRINKKITKECTALGTKLSTFIESFSQKNGIDVTLVDSIDTSAQGKVLQVEIVHAVSAGNAFIGHRKHVEIEGTLWENGEKVASFSGQRSSGGGFAAGYKGSCSVLGRCVKTLGKDIAGWLKSPKDGAVIGE